MAVDVVEAEDFEELEPESLLESVEVDPPEESDELELLDESLEELELVLDDELVDDDDDPERASLR